LSRISLEWIHSKGRIILLMMMRYMWPASKLAKKTLGPELVIFYKANERQLDSYPNITNVHAVLSMILFFCGHDLAMVYCKMSVKCTFFSYSEGTGSVVPFYFASAFCLQTSFHRRPTGPSTAPSAGVSIHESCLTSAPAGRAIFSVVLPFGADCGRSEGWRWLKRTAPFFFDMLDQ